MKIKIFKWLTIVCSGLLILDKSFAYIGFSGLYITELTIIFGLLFIIPYSFRTLNISTYLLIGIWIYTLLGIILIDSYRYSIGEIIRDFLLVFYSAVFFLITFNDKISKRDIFSALLNLMRYLRYFIFVYPILFFVFRTAKSILPVFNTVTLFHIKPGDAAITISIFILLREEIKITKYRTIENFFLLLNSVLLLSISRASIVVILIAVSYVFIRNASSKKSIKYLVYLVPILVFVISFWDFQLSIGLHRVISFSQIGDNIFSIFSSTSKEGLEGSRSWRIDWWTYIFENKFVLDRILYGDGFGVNLAQIDGFQVLEDNSLRSPHNFMMNILSRGGILYLTLWIAFILSIILRKTTYSLTRSIKIIIIIFILNSLLDVYLEGPMGAFPLWFFAGIYNKLTYEGF